MTWRNSWPAPADRRRHHGRRRAGRWAARAGGSRPRCWRPDPLPARRRVPHRFARVLPRVRVVPRRGSGRAGRRRRLPARARAPVPGRGRRRGRRVPVAARRRHPAFDADRDPWRLRGRGLTLAALLAIRDAGLPQPAGGRLACRRGPISRSPPTPSSAARRPTRTSAVGEAEPAVADYLRDTDPTHPLASPARADLSNLAPVLVHASDCEVLADDATLIAESIEAAGGEVELGMWPDMTHVWHAMTPHVPEARDAVDQVATFIRAPVHRPGDRHSRPSVPTDWDLWPCPSRGSFTRLVVLRRTGAIVPRRKQKGDEAMGAGAWAFATIARAPGARRGDRCRPGVRSQQRRQGRSCVGERHCGVAVGISRSSRRSSWSTRGGSLTVTNDGTVDAQPRDQGHQPQDGRHRAREQRTPRPVVVEAGHVHRVLRDRRARRRGHDRDAARRSRRRHEQQGARSRRNDAARRRG